MAYKDVKVEIKGIQEVNAALRAYGKDLGRGLELALNRTALVALTDVRNAIENPPKTGRIYIRGRNNDIKHQASKEGEAPATDTGALVISIYNEYRGKYTKAIGSRLPYAYYLEFGTLDGKLGKRPAWIPAVERAMPRLLELVQIAIAKAKARAEKTTK
jgi:hypothetical protein